MPRNAGAVGLPGQLNRRGVKIFTASGDLEAHDCGSIVILNAAGGGTITLPTIAQAGMGWNVRVFIRTNPTTAWIITEDGTADTDKVIVGINELEVDTGDDGPRSAGCTTVTFAANVALAGDFVDIFCDGTNYYVHGQTNADGGITLA